MPSALLPTPVTITKMKTLDELAIQYNADKSSKVHDYCRHYDPLFVNHLQWKAILEFGVEDGNSLRMWADYAPWTKIIGVDKAPKVFQDDFNNKNIIIRVGRQEDLIFLNEYVSYFGPFDLIVDDASHRPTDQIFTFTVMWPHVAPGGFYAIEDLQTSFIPEYVGKNDPIYVFLSQKIYLHSSDLMGLQPNQGDIDMIYFANDLVIFRKKIK